MIAASHLCRWLPLQGWLMSLPLLARSCPFAIIFVNISVVVDNITTTTEAHERPCHHQNEGAVTQIKPCRPKPELWVQEVSGWAFCWESVHNGPTVCACGVLEVEYALSASESVNVSVCVYVVNRWDPPTVDPTYDVSNKRNHIGNQCVSVRMTLSISTVLQGWFGKCPKFTYLYT